MSASLVGSEMCIRDRTGAAHPGTSPWPARPRCAPPAWSAQRRPAPSGGAGAAPGESAIAGAARAAAWPA
eukprot:13593257-Alexandrium_andersonii.AAC.1